jgi:hypothetical protein
VSVYVIVAIIEKRLQLEASLYTILQILSVTILILNYKGGEGCLNQGHGNLT